ncbi:hypothetical protein [Streptomyces sp. IBSBF 2806]|uniref:hypothetical protein n=1 Tax=Streptomyces sp. IBSBF 2806 TaxID=2903529 RepID=UPI002FDC0A1F
MRSSALSDVEQAPSSSNVVAVLLVDADRLPVEVHGRPVPVGLVVLRDVPEQLDDHRRRPSGAGNPGPDRARWGARPSRHPAGRPAPTLQ